ncbi:MAG TPA: hypothetical protein VK395_07105 [Gemmataceae bacterium]|nr:hypothetical protein [Gemmataceae bacterium]
MHSCRSPVPLAVLIADFTVGVVAATVIFKWRAERAGSVWAPVMLAVMFASQRSDA